MKTLNYFFAIAFTLLGLAALIGALFFGATWHFRTTVLCTILVILFIHDNNKEK